MPLLYLLPSPLGHSYYQTAQLAAFALYVALLLGQGYRRGYPARAWLPLVAASTLALVLGCQLVLLPLGQWLAWLGGEGAAVQALAGGPRSVVGGAVASWLAVLLLKRALGFRGWAVLDAFAGPLCWALAVQSVGCMLAGCCWGEPAAGAWGVAYGPGAAAFATQVALGHLPAAARHTAPLVPTQLLQLLLCAGTGLGLHQLRRRAASWPGGSGYLLAVGLLCAGRFGIEFWRDPLSEPLLAGPVPLLGLSLSGLQWLLLAEALVLLGSWAWQLRRARAGRAAEVVPAPHSLAPMLVGLGLLVATARLAPSVLSRPEIAVLQLLLLLVLLAEAHTLLTTLGRGVPRLAGLPLAVLLGGALLLATAQAPAPQREAPTTSSLTISGGMLGNYHDEELQVHHGGGCGGGGNSYTEYYNLYHRTLAGGVDVTSLKTLSNGRQRELGGGLWVGELRTGQHFLGYAPGPFVVQPDTVLRTTLTDLHFFYGQQLGRDWLTLRYRVGLHTGVLGKYTYFQEYNNTSAPTTETNFAPEIMLRLGHPRLLFAQYDGGYGAENALGAYTTRVALGSGLGHSDGRQLLLGYANSAHYSSPDMAFASANLRLPAGLSAVSLEPYFATNFARHNSFSVKLHYQLGR